MVALKLAGAATDGAVAIASIAGSAGDEDPDEGKSLETEAATEAVDPAASTFQRAAQPSLTKSASPGALTPSLLASFGITPANIEALEDNMRPRAYSGLGFLGKTESLVEVLTADHKTLQEHGITRDEIAALLDQIVSGRAKHYLIEVGKERYSVTVYAQWGHQECPFGEYAGDGYGHAQPLDYDLDISHRGSRNYEITNLRTGQNILLGGLLVHLIRVHAFFEGKGTSYRMAPEDIIRFFDMDNGNRSAKVIDTPQYLYEGYGVYSYREGLSRCIDNLHFIDPKIRASWKKRHNDILSMEARNRDDALEDLNSDIETATILAAGFFPEKYHFQGTKTKIPPNIERFRAAKVLREIVKFIDEITKEDASFRKKTLGPYDKLFDLFSRVRDMQKFNRYEVSYEHVPSIEEILSRIDSVIKKYSSYAEAKTELEPLLLELKLTAETEFTTAAAVVRSDPLLTQFKETVDAELVAAKEIL